MTPSWSFAARGFLSFAFGILLASGGCATKETMKKADGHYQEGVANLTTDRQQAFVSFQKAITINPNHKDAHYSLGHLYALQGKYKLAEGEFLEVLRIDSSNSEAHNYLGQMYEQQNRWPDAIRSYRRALSNQLYATPDIVRFNLGRALAHEGEFEEATRAFEDALVVSPPSVPPAAVHLELGRTYHQLGYDTKARESLARVSSLDGEGEFAAAAAKLMEKLKP